MTDTLPRTAGEPDAAETAATPTPETWGVGTRRKRFDAEGRVRGTIRYTGDEPNPPGTLRVAIHRSTMPHARIVSVDVSGARETAGVVEVVTGADLRACSATGCSPGRHSPTSRAWPWTRSASSGEPIAAVLAHDAEVARAAADAVVVEYEELPPVYDIEDAVRGDSLRARHAASRARSSPTWPTCATSAART